MQNTEEISRRFSILEWSSFFASCETKQSTSFPRANVSSTRGLDRVCTRQLVNTNTNTDHPDGTIGLSLLSVSLLTEW